MPRTRTRDSCRQPESSAHGASPPGTESPEESTFYRGLAEGRILGQRCPTCHKVYAPPRSACPVDRVATTDEVAETIRWLAIDAPASATGTIVDVNGASYVR